MKKKILSLLLAFVLCAGLSVPAFAAEVGDTSITTEDGFTYTLSNAIVGTETWTREGFTKDYEWTMITSTVYLIPEGTIITLPSDKLNDFSLEYYTPPYSDQTAPIQSMGSGGPSEQSGDFIGRMYSSYLVMFQSQPENTPAPVSSCVLRISHITRPDAYSALKEGDVYLRVAPTPVQPIAEVPSSWAADAVNSAIAAGIVPDVLQAKYTQATTRAEFCALAVALYETATGTEITERQAFSDTSDINVQKMGSLGVVTGVGDGNFAPDQKLTREQAATMLARLANAMSYPMPQQSATSFADSADISSWALEAVAQIQAAGIMSGVGENRFAPADDYTREQSILTMMRLFDFKAV